MSLAQFIIRIAITVCVIILAAQAGRKWPQFAGLIATMPLTSIIVLFWLYPESRKDPELLTKYSLAAAWGIIPSILFFISAYFCFKNNLAFSRTLLYSFSAWGIGAVMHYLFLR